ncbi:aldose 1-epimerase family protein [Paenibacillus wynnii]|uniref:aldose 1-epimerase family protein n=1 Tax=Paenibacillus wynnii TaxID=268407 RepID=UPI0027D7A607|nr:aldose 1-epimerase family protein [Paenibacillus wynnii]
MKSIGAELISFKKEENGVEYIWNGDTQYWTGHSPVLFPIVCAVNNGEIKVDGKSYPLKNHGFVRHNEFELVEASESRAVYRHTYNETTLEIYPFKFDLYITYTLEGNKLEIDYRVDNIDEQEIFFQLGTHPAFNCPLDEGGHIQDYYLEFEQKETLERLFMNKSNQLISGKSEVVLENEHILPLSHEMFEEGALVFRNVNSHRVALKSKESTKSVVLSYENFPYMGVWQPKNAPFVCVEPWHGIADADNFTGELKDKEMIISLNPGERFKSSLTIEVN